MPSEFAAANDQLAANRLNSFFNQLPSIGFRRRLPIPALKFETHSTSYANDRVSLSYNLLYPVAAPNPTTLRAFQRAVLTDCFDPALTNCTPLPNPAALIAARLSWYQSPETTAVTTHMPQCWQVETDFVAMNRRFASWTVTAAFGNSNSSSIPVTVGRILDCDGGWLVPATHLWRSEALAGIRNRVLDNLTTADGMQQLAIDRTAAESLPLNNAFANRDGITYTYNPGELSARENGGFRALLPWREIEQLLAPRFRAIATTDWSTITPRPQTYHAN